jgi:RNA polymerase sigma-70 factor, ECF subfamily
LGKARANVHQGEEESRLVLDRPGFHALFLAQAAFVWRVLRRHGVPAADLEDVCQDVFLVVHRRLSEFEGRAGVRTWLYEIARRSALSQRRSRARVPLPASEIVQELADAGAGPERNLEQQRALSRLEAGLAALPEEKREAFVLYELEEMTLAEVAEAQGCAINTAHYRVTSAREQLRAASERAEGRAPSARVAGRP